jgi:hypothetical protein
VVKGTQLFVTSLNHILALEDSYAHVLSLIFKNTYAKSTVRTSGDTLLDDLYGEGYRHINSKLRSTVRTLGTEAFANAFIEYACSTQDSILTDINGGVLSDAERGSMSSSYGLKAALKCHILKSEDRISKGSIETRRVVKLLAKYCTPDSLIHLEGLWRTVIAESVLLLCTTPQAPSSTLFTRCPSPYAVDSSPSSAWEAGVAYAVNAIPGSPLSSAVSGSVLSPYTKSSNVQQPGAFASTLVHTLLQYLAKAREVSTVDLRCLGCSMSADLAYAVAYRQLPREVSVELAKALAVRISTLLDQQKQMTSDFTSPAQPRTTTTAAGVGVAVGTGRDGIWASLQHVADLIQVLFSQTSTEFQHFYEVLLARRLLRCRYISLEIERKVTFLLPALDKCVLMIR